PTQVRTAPLGVIVRLAVLLEVRGEEEQRLKGWLRCGQRSQHSITILVATRPELRQLLDRPGRRSSQPDDALDPAAGRAGRRTGHLEASPFLLTQVETARHRS